MCFDFGIISGPIIAGLTYLGGIGSAGGGAGAVTAGAGAWTGATTAGAVTAASLASTVAATAVTAVGQSQAAKAQAAAGKYNADVAAQQALDAERRGSMAEAEHRTQSKRILGAMHAETGPSGVVGATGSGADVFAETAEYGARQAAAARLSGGREAFGFRSQRELDLYGGRTALAQGAGRVAGTALSGASSVFKQNQPWWSTWQRKDDPFDYFARSNYGYNA